MQAEWNAALCNPTTDVIPGVAPLPTFEPVFTLSKCIKNKADLTFLEQRSVQSNRAIAKMRCFLELSLEDSGVGRQLANEDTEEKTKSNPGCSGWDKKPCHNREEDERPVALQQMAFGQSGWMLSTP